MDRLKIALVAIIVLSIVLLYLVANDKSLPDHVRYGPWLTMLLAVYGLSDDKTTGSGWFGGEEKYDIFAGIKNIESIDDSLLDEEDEHKRQEYVNERKAEMEKILRAVTEDETQKQRYTVQRKEDITSIIRSSLHEIKKTDDLLLTEEDEERRKYYSDGIKKNVENTIMGIEDSVLRELGAFKKMREMKNENKDLLNEYLYEIMSVGVDNKLTDINREYIMEISEKMGFNKHRQVEKFDLLAKPIANQVPAPIELNKPIISQVTAPAEAVRLPVEPIANQVPAPIESVQQPEPVELVQQPYYEPAPCSIL